MTTRAELLETDWTIAPTEPTKWSIGQVLKSPEEIEAALDNGCVLRGSRTGSYEWYRHVNNVVQKRTIGEMWEDHDMTHRIWNLCWTWEVVDPTWYTIP